MKVSFEERVRLDLAARQAAREEKARREMDALHQALIQKLVSLGIDRDAITSDQLRVARVGDLRFTVKKEQARVYFSYISKYGCSRSFIDYPTLLAAIEDAEQR